MKYIDSLCIGSGRFIRTVLVPTLIQGVKLHPVIVQTRGTSFVESCRTSTSSSCPNPEDSIMPVQSDTQNPTSAPILTTYEVDTVHFDGSIETQHIPTYGIATLGTRQGKESVMHLLDHMNHISIIGIGVTEAGLASVQSPVLGDLIALFYKIYTRMNTMKKENVAEEDQDTKKNEDQEINLHQNQRSGRGDRDIVMTCPNPNGRICVINTDNVPKNGDLIRQYMIELASNYKPQEKNCINSDLTFLEFMQTKVTFHNTMVDRITSERPSSNGIVPRAEPTPYKALVIEDLHLDLPMGFYHTSLQKTHGVFIRTQPGQLHVDITLKLRIANATHTALAHTMALSKLTMTNVLSNDSLSSFCNDVPSNNHHHTPTHAEVGRVLLSYLDSFFHTQISIAANMTLHFPQEEINAVYQDWRQRLLHPYFGLSTFFITQNGSVKLGIRIGPTIQDLVVCGKSIHVSTVYAIASILRFLTPVKSTHIKSKICQDTKNTYIGWFDERTSCDTNIPNDQTIAERSSNHVVYADQLSYNLSEGWYKFRCNCIIKNREDSSIPLPLALAQFSSPQQPYVYEHIVREFLTSYDGGNLNKIEKENSATFQSLVRSVCTLYARMIAGDGMINILSEMVDKKFIYTDDGLSSSCDILEDGCSNNHHKLTSDGPLPYRQSPIPDHSYLLKDAVIDCSDLQQLKALVYAEVASALVVDLHTHLLPPSHGNLCLWGIDEMLTYHYLVAEYFMTAPPNITPDLFYEKSKVIQADMIWQALFIERSPLSEACRGVITTLKELGMEKELLSRDLIAIRRFYAAYRNDGSNGCERFSEMIFKLTGVKYAVMTNVPFDINEVQYWQRNKPTTFSHRYRSALRIDPLISGDFKAVKNILRVSGYDVTLEGARLYLRDWCDILKPEYMMASTPHDFILPEEKSLLTVVSRNRLNEDAMKQPFAFVDIVSNNRNCQQQECHVDEESCATVIDEHSDLLREVVMKICEEKDLPLALKIGAHRGLNQKLRQAGDGVVGFADASVLARLCNRFPGVRFLATFLSRNNQHEACVLQSKFRNLHLYGCWWYCNNPSIVEEITKMRLEMLGTAFTAQHSDARVLDQLIYKWSHARATLAKSLFAAYSTLLESGWNLLRYEIRRDVASLFGGSYEAFMSKSLSSFGA